MKVRDRSVEVRVSVPELDIEPPCKALGGRTEDKQACFLVWPPNPCLELNR